MSGNIKFFVHKWWKGEKYKTIYTKAEDLENIELNALPVYDDDDDKN